MFERFGILNMRFPLIAILNTAIPFLYFQFLMLSSHLFFCLPSGRVNISFHLYIFFFTILSSGICCKWPNQFNLCAFDVLYSCVLLIHRLFCFSMYHLFLL